MSWKSISGNQTISRANLQDAINTGVFVQKESVPSTSSNKSVTKSEIQNYIYTWDLYPAFRSKSANQLPVKSNMAVQSNQVYAVNSNAIYLGNTNRDWIFLIFYNAGDVWASISSSIDNRCILAGRSYTSGGDGGGAWFSNDYGETFTRLDSVMTTNDSATSTAMSSNGELMILTRQVGSFDADRAKIYRSYDAGVNWVVGYQDGIRYNFNGAAMSGAGNYATVLGSDGTNYYVFTSNTFGASYTKTYLCQGIKTLITGCVGMSKSGQYQLLTPPEPTGSSLGYFYVSNNYGSSWTAVTVVTAPLSPNDVFKGCSVSASGDYMTVAAYSLTLGQLRTYASSDFGISWTVSIGTAIGQAVDASGQFQYQQGRRSIDYGNTWFADSVIAGAKSISVNTTTYTTPHIYGISTGGNVFKSIDQGTSFSMLPLSGYFTKVATSGGSNNGKYIVALLDNNPGGFPNYSVYHSSNYGASWSTNLSSSGQVMMCCAVSDDGYYLLASSYNGPSNESYIYRSADSGVSWQYMTTVSFQAQDCAISHDGKYMTVIATEPGGDSTSVTVYNSSNYGSSWTGVGSYFGQGYVSIAMSTNGKFRTFASTDPTNARIYISSDYGNTWVTPWGISGCYATSCALDDSGRVGLVSVVANDGNSSLIYFTTDRWDSYDTYSTTGTYPGPLGPPLISGVNVSSDGTYWSAVSSNSSYSFTCVTGNRYFISHANTPVFNKISK
jgi:hypothetical protein